MDIRRYQGLDTYDGPDRFTKLNLEYVNAVERPFCQPNGVNWYVYQADAVTLCPETAEYLYNGFTPLEVKHKRGSRPKLEAIVAETTKDSMSDREKALALLAFVRDLYKKRPDGDAPFTGGTEEENIEAGQNNCGDLARVYACLMQIAGFPARICMHYGTVSVDGKMLGGHGVCEVYIEGRWAMFDIRGQYCEWPGGRVANLLDLIRFPDMVDRQPEHVLKMSRGGKYDSAHMRLFFAGRRVHRVMNYFVWDAHKYDFTRNMLTPDRRKARTEGQLKVMAEYAKKFRDEGFVF